MNKFTKEMADAQNRRFDENGKGRTLTGILIENAPQKLPDMFMKRIKRVRQSEKPVLNGLELQWFMHLQSVYLDAVFHKQAMRLKLANGAWYKPDICATIEGQLTCYECKGPKEGKNVARGILALKFAAHEWPDVVFFLVWKSPAGVWCQQRILP